MLGDWADVKTEVKKGERAILKLKAHWGRPGWGAEREGKSLQEAGSGLWSVTDRSEKVENRPQEKDCKELSYDFSWRQWNRLKWWPGKRMPGWSPVSEGAEEGEESDKKEPSWGVRVWIHRTNLETCFPQLGSRWKTETSVFPFIYHPLCSQHVSYSGPFHAYFCLLVFVLSWKLFGWLSDLVSAHMSPPQRSFPWPSS